MTWRDFLIVAGPAVALLALLLQTLQWFRKRRDEQWLENMKGAIRREVEENLKSHESRLRLVAELRLRAHDRSAQLLREMVTAAWETHDAIRGYALVVRASPSSPDREAAYERAYAAVAKVTALASTAPPEHEPGPMVARYREAFNSVNSLALGFGEPRDRATTIVDISKMVDAALAEATTLAKRWNASLWANEVAGVLVPTRA